MRRPSLNPAASFPAAMAWSAFDLLCLAAYGFMHYHYGVGP
jgi:hypothetical protein